MQQVVYKPQRRTKITTAPTHTIISDDELGAYLRIPSAAITVESDILTANIELATEIVENYTWLTLRETTFTGYFSHIYPYLQIDTAPITDVANILGVSYLYDDGTDIDYATYALGDSYSTGSYANLDIKLTELGFANLTLKNLEDLNIKSLVNQYPITVSYKAGYAYDSENSKYLLPQSLRMAILQLASKYYTDRGDCVGCVSANGYLMPPSVKTILDSYSLQTIAMGVDSSDYYVGTTYQSELTV
jgi:hypothetical protein